MDFETDENGAEDSHGFGIPQDGESTQAAPTATSGIAPIPKATLKPLQMEETADPSPNPTEDNGNAGAENARVLDDFLSEDYLLPVSTTHSPPVRHSQTHNEQNNRLDVPAQDITRPEVGDGFTFSEDAPPHNTDMSATNPEYQTTASGIPTTPTSTPVGSDGVYVYSYHEESTLDSEDQETLQTVQLDERASEIPQTTSQAFMFPSGSMLEDLDSDHSDFRTAYATGGYSWDTDFNPTTSSLSASEESMPTPIPFLHTSGSHQASDISISSGTGTEPPTDLERATQTSPADLLPATKKYDPTEPPFTQKGGAELSPQAPWFDSAGPNETVTPVTARSGGAELLPGATDSPGQVTPDAPHQDPPASTHPAVLWPILLPTSGETTASPQVTFSGYWVTGNWSAVSSSVALNHSLSQHSFVFFDK